MCGIAGFTGGGEAAWAEAMADALVHRGPDGGGLWSDADAGVHLAHRRLSILDHAGGEQPMVDGELTVVFNGEIYNHRALRAELEADGARFTSDHSDTEVLLHGWRAWGRGLSERLDGMWAFALIDRSRRQLFLSRDCFGEKPLFLTRLAGGGLAFASETTALERHPAVTLELDSLSVAKYFAYGFVPSPRSLWRGVEQLEPGEDLVVDLTTDRWHRRHHFVFTLEPESIGDDATVGRRAAELREAIRRSVVDRTEADVPLGVFLSGGIDSSTVAACLARSRGARRCDTFAIGFEQKSFDEHSWAQAVADHCGLRHHATILGTERLAEALQAVDAGLDTPIADSSLPATWLLAHETRKSVTVALGGDGADELFAGYDPFKALRPARVLAGVLPASLHPALRWLAGTMPTGHGNLSLDFKIKRTLRPLDRPPDRWLPMWMGPLDADGIGRLVGRQVHEEELYSEAIALWDRDGHQHPVDRHLAFFTRYYLTDDILVKVDRCAMLNSLEVRAPFLARSVVDIARRLPWWLKYGAGRGKYLLKAAVAGWLPEAVIHRPKKGFGSPIGAWFRDGTISAGTAAGPCVSGELDQLLQRHRAGRADERLALFAHRQLSARVTGG